MKPIVILSGPVGAGKSTVSKELLDLSSPSTALIEGDLFWQFLSKPNPKQSMKSVFGVTMSAMVAASVPYAMADIEVILDFSIPPWFLDRVKKIVARREIPLDYVVLRPSLEVCAERAAGRPQGTVPNYAQFEDFYAAFEAPNLPAHIEVIDNGDLSAAELAHEIRKGLASGRFRVPTD